MNTKSNLQKILTSTVEVSGMVLALHRRTFLKRTVLGAIGVSACSTGVLGQAASQPGIAWQQRITDAKKLFGSTRDPDGAFVFVGIFGASPYIVAVDETGTVRWSWHNDDAGVAQSILSTSDSGYLLGVKGTEESPAVYKLDSDRELEWSKHVSERRVSSVLVAQFNPGLYGVSWNEGTSHTQKAHLAAVDSSGAVRWRRSFEHSSQLNWAEANALLSADGAVVLVGMLSVDGTEKQMVKVTENDSVEWAVSVDSAPTRAVRTDDGGYVLESPEYAEDERQQYSHARLTKLDAQRNEVWSKTYENDIPHYETRDVVQTADGGYALLGVGYKTDTFDNPVTTLLKTASNGETEWTVRYEHGDDDYSTTHSRLGASTLLPAGRGKLMVAGAAALDERPNGWIALADESAEGVATFTPTPTTTSHRESTSETEQTTSVEQSTEAKDQTGTSVPGFDALTGVGSVLASSLVARWRLQRKE